MNFQSKRADIVVCGEVRGKKYEVKWYCNVLSRIEIEERYEFASENSTYIRGYGKSKGWVV